MGITGALVWTATSEGRDVKTNDYWTAGFMLLAGLLVLAIALAFAFAYHRRVIRAMTRVALVRTGPLTVTGESIQALDTGGVTALSTDGGLGIQVPGQVVAGTKATFVAQGYADGATLQWVADDGDPSSGTDPTFETTFEDPGPTTIGLAASDGGSATVQVVVGAPEPDEEDGAAERSSISFPFAVRGWARFVVLVFGVAVIGALMAIDRISTDGGVGLLGALLGVGAATATNPGAEPQEPAPQAPPQSPSQPQRPAPQPAAPSGVRRDPRPRPRTAPRRRR